MKSRREKKNQLKRTILAAVIIATLLTGLPAGATTCLCVGAKNSKYCGSGGVGGAFLQVYTPDSNSVKFCLLTVELQATLNSAGKAYDSTTGWFCWNGNLQ
ncbi:MAG TPA: hypothetical protein P5244_09545 [Syntrophales bacterium]|nr:hypothetical protein [Syntrophales bacterium]